MKNYKREMKSVEEYLYKKSINNQHSCTNTQHSCIILGESALLK